MEDNTMSGHKPSTQQQAIIDWALNGGGSANIVARAGSGKTSTLLMLVEALKRAGKGNMLLCAFNKAIAGELENKLARAGVPYYVAKASTLHAAGFRIWAKVCPERPKVDGTKTYKIVDAMVADNTMTEAEHALWFTFVCKAVSHAKLSGVGVYWQYNDSDRWDELISHYDLMDHVAAGDDIEIKPERGIQLAVLALKRSALLADKVIDFDDMLWCPMAALSPARRQQQFPQYDFVMIDEAQDTNETRRGLALAMLKPGGRCIAVGDDRQAVYGFTGANADAMDLIKQELGSEELPLTVSYRCARSVIEAAQALVPDIEAWQQAPQGLVERVPDAEWEPTTLQATDAVLCRVNAPLVSLAYRCIRAGVPCRIEGRDIGAGLKTMATRWRSSSLAVFQTSLEAWFSREIEKAEKEKHGGKAKAQRIEDKFETLVALIEATKKEHGQRASVKDMVALIDRLFGDTDKNSHQRPVLTFSSVHKAKGKEWKTVYVYGADKYMPHPMATTEWQQVQEDNLTYVAITRAMHRLVWVDSEN